MAKTIDDLRDELFKALEGLGSGKMEVERARAVSQVAQTIINSAKVEVEAHKVRGGNGNIAFLTAGVLPAAAAGNDGVVEQGKGYTVRRHQLK